MLKDIDLKVKQNEDIEDLISDVSINIRMGSLIATPDIKDKLKLFIGDLLNTFEEKIKVNNYEKK